MEYDNDVLEGQPARGEMDPLYTQEALPCLVPLAHRIIVPKLKVDAPVVPLAPGCDGREEEYNDVVIQVAHGGNPYLCLFSAHAKGPERGHFEDLAWLDYGDEITLQNSRSSDVYLVGANMLIPGNDIWPHIIFPKRPQIAHVTCHPWLIATHRIVILARLAASGLDRVAPDLPKANLLNVKSAYVEEGYGSFLGLPDFQSKPHKPQHTTIQTTTESTPQAEAKGIVTQAVSMAITPTVAKAGLQETESAMQQKVVAQAAIQQVHATQQNTTALAERLDKVVEGISKLATPDDMYRVFRDAQQMGG